MHNNCNRLDPGVIAVTMSYTVWWSSTSARRYVSADVRRHFIPLKIDSMKVGVERMNPDTRRTMLFRVAASRCVFEQCDYTLLSDTRLGQNM